MVEGIGIVTSDFVAQAGAALLAWGFLALASYICTVWCFSYQMRWRHAVRSAGIVIGVLGVSLGLLYVFSVSWAQVLTTIIVPSLVCVFALHSLLLVLKEFLAQRAPLHVHAGRFYTTLLLLYAIFIGSAALVIYLESPYVSQCFTLTLNYFIYAAVLGIFALSLRNHRHGHSY